MLRVILIMFLTGMVECCEYFTLSGFGEFDGVFDYGGDNTFYDKTKDTIFREDSCQWSVMRVDEKPPRYFSDDCGRSWAMNNVTTEGPRVQCEKDFGSVVSMYSVLTFVGVLAFVVINVFVWSHGRNREEMSSYLCGNDEY